MTTLKNEILQQFREKFTYFDKKDLRKKPRFLQWLIAELHGYFWLPCPICGEYFGGHEEPSGMLMTSYSGGYTTCANCIKKADILNKQKYLDQSYNAGYEQGKKDTEDYYNRAQKALGESNEMQSATWEKAIRMDEREKGEQEMKEKIIKLKYEGQNVYLNEAIGDVLKVITSTEE